MEHRTILHMDMDAFYASVEMRDNPSLRGKPLIIGALPNERGVVSTCSYEARPFGVRSGMSIKEAYRLCPQGIYMHGNHSKYRAVSHQVHKILMDYTDQIEFVALDEGYLDITHSLSLFGSAEKIGRQIKERVLNETQLTCSVGIGYNKMTAKLASEEKKPDGFFVIPNEAFFRELMKSRPVSVLPGVGRKTAASLEKQGIRCVEDLWRFTPEELERLMGVFGQALYHSSRGFDNNPVHRLGEGTAKSYGKEVTYQKDMTEIAPMESTLRLLARDLSIGLMEDDLWCLTITLKIKYNNLQLHTRSQTLASPVQNAAEIFQTAFSLLQKAPLTRPVRLLGISTSGFTNDPTYQLSLDEPKDHHEKQEKLKSSLLQLYGKYGKNIIHTGSELESRTILEEGHFD